MSSNVMPNTKILKLGLFSLSLIPIILFLFVVSQRISFPYDMEWAEGAALNQVNQILSGERIYAPPSTDFSPLVYTPFFYYLSAALIRVIGDGFLGMRIISVAASLGSFGIIFSLVWKETRSAILGWLSGALYLACFEISSGFFDLARVDSLYIFILLAGLWLLYRSESKWSFGAAGLIISVGFFTKQSAVIVFLPLIIYFFYTGWRKAWPLLMTVFLGILIPVMLINQNTEGWFNYYIFYLPSEHGYSITDAINYWVGDLFRPLGIAVGFSVMYVIAYIFAKIGHKTDNKDIDQGADVQTLNEQPGSTRNKERECVFLLFALGAVAASWVTRASNGGGSNNVMAAYAAISIMFGLGIDNVLMRIHKSLMRDVVIVLLILIQYVGLIYNPFNFIPSDADRELNQTLIEAITEAPGEVLVPYRSHLPEMAGKKAHIHVVGLFELTDYFHGKVQAEGLEIIGQIRSDICEQRYGIIVLDQPIPWFQNQIDAAYIKTGLLETDSNGRQSKMLSWQKGFENMYIPRPDKINDVYCPE